MKYTIVLARFIDTNTGDNLLVYISENEDDFKKKLKELENFFIKTGTYLRTETFSRPTYVRAFISYVFSR